MLVDGSGNRKATASRTLLAGAELAETVSALFEVSAAECAGNILVHATGAISGYQKTDSVVKGVVTPARRPATSTEVYAPQFASGRFGPDRYATELTITNASEEYRTITIQLRGNDGAVTASLPNSTSVQLAPGQQMRRDGAALFGLADPAWSEGGVEGSLVVTADGPGMIGEVKISDPGSRSFVAVIPMQDGSSGELIVPHLIQGAAGTGRYFTGLALQNPTSATVEVSVRAMAASGELTGFGTVVLGPYQRVSRTIPGLIPGLEQQVGGYLLISPSGGQIAACAVIGSQELGFLSAVPAERTLENGTTPRLK